MCGIAGIFELEGGLPVSERRLKAMTDAIAARGPDGEGQWTAPGVGLGHRRLAIIDPEGGQQPVIDPSAGIAVTFNGMIYNFRELRAELEERGAVFTTSSDTEVLLHGWRVWGYDLVERLDGFFAIGIWDPRDESFTLIRDRWGKKPLYYTIQGKTVLFGSDPRALLAGMESEPPIRADALADYLALGYVPEPKSIYEGIERLAPAHTLRLSRREGVGTPQRYWRITIDPDTGERNIDDAAEELNEILRRAVKKRLIADVPLGAFLSGGVDSSAMVAIASEIRGPGIDALTMAFDDPDLDESHLAAEVAKLHGAKHHIEKVEADAMADTAALLAAFPEPFADASAIPTLQLCHLAARHVKVAISGDGGDELFAGYRRYPFHLAEERVKARIPSPIARGLFGPLARAYPALPPSAPKALRAKSTLEALSSDAMGGLFRATAYMQERDRDALMGSATRIDAYSTADLLRAYAQEADTDDPLARAQYVDLMTWLPGRMLVKVDRASMAAGVEVRNPLLDMEVAAWAARLPTALKLEGFKGKRVLRTALEQKVPSSILNAKKRGFVAPIGDWMTGEFAQRMDTLTSSSRLIEAGLIERSKATELWEKLKTGKAETSRQLWSLLMLEEFLKSGGEKDSHRHAA